MGTDPRLLRDQCALTLERTELDGLGSSTKARSATTTCPAAGASIVVTDRISAFDRVLGTLPFKGQVLNGLAAYWFEQTRDDRAQPRAVRARPERGVHRVHAAARGDGGARLPDGTSPHHLTAYQRGERAFCGHRLPEGLTPHQQLPEPLLTPTTKAPNGEHDENVSREEILARGRSPRGLRRAPSSRCAVRVRSEAVRRARPDPGRHQVRVRQAPRRHASSIDEIHTPDSSRFWFAKSYERALADGQAPESFDKEYVRRWLADQGFRGDGPPPTLPDDVRSRPRAATSRRWSASRGETFEPDTEDPRRRIPRNLGIA